MNQRLLLLTLAAACAAGSLTAQNVSFVPGDLIVEQVGNTSSAISSGASPVIFDEIAPGNGTVVEQVDLPVSNTSGNIAVTDSGKATSAGQLTLSGDGQYIAFVGYDAPLGTASITSSNSGIYPRVVGTMSFNGTLDLNVMNATAYDAQNIRSAYTDNGTDLWTAGNANATVANSSVMYTLNGSGIDTGLNVGGNTRVINAFGGQLYGSTETGSASRVQTYGTGEPTTGPVTVGNMTGLPTTGNGTAFVMFDLNGSSTPNVLYLANDNDAAAAVLKYSLVGGTWTADGSVSFTGNGCYGITGEEITNSSVTLYGTYNTGSGAGELFTFTDSTGYDSTMSGSVSILALAPANTTFDGVAFVPEQVTGVPEPASASLGLGAAVLALGAWCRSRKFR
jgi:hypothetical protein